MTLITLGLANMILGIIRKILDHDLVFIENTNLIVGIVLTLMSIHYFI